MNEQLVFDLPLKTAFGREDFFVSSANALAVDMLENWAQWPNSKLILSGPRGAGKTHLANIWAEEVGANVLGVRTLHHVELRELCEAPLCIDGMEKIAKDSLLQEIVFHLHNLMAEEGKPLLFTGVGVPNSWQISLADLLSRLQGTSLANLSAPDEALLSAVLMKQFADRQIVLDAKVVDYLVLRMERSFEFVAQLVPKLDKAALTARKKITVPLARDVLDGMQGAKA